ncbi:BTB/POZ domain-containing protein At2g13690-like [Andrographis paniculata]|uniref:BTB/POZ domain-containing protein At2g13690-like n=1 Tax=Andrographis paniculata TaxID=175694 RepID=UPI0021E6E99E|nr:BTB/POZ domain-containing protein At2g13690-like [Andrographis paniculata]
MMGSKQRRRRRRWWCCSLAAPPDNGALSHANSLRSQTASCDKKSEIASPKAEHHQKLPRTRGILSPGRVSPISDQPVIAINSLLPPPPFQSGEQPESPPAEGDSESSVEEESSSAVFDVRLNLVGKNGKKLILEVNSEVLTANSGVFANLIAYHRRSSGAGGVCAIDVPEVENLGVFSETIKLMFEDDDPKQLLKTGVPGAINMLEVSAGIKFDRGVSSCLKYLESMPWTEEEEQKLKESIAKLRLDYALTTGISDRLFARNSMDSQQTLTKHLISSITTCTDSYARSELKSLIKSLLSETSLNETDYPDMKEDIFAVCRSCLGSLNCLFEEATGNDERQAIAKTDSNKTLLERISKEVDNLNWLFDILFYHQMAEDFVVLWADQKELLKMHENTSPMVRYEISRVSATLFIAMGAGKLHCPSGTRLALLQAWFRPMLSDFSWLHRCRKVLDMKALEEAMGQALLTLPIHEQCPMFMEWFHYFSRHGTESPNLSKAFSIWWRRSFLGRSETLTGVSRSQFP